MRPTVLVTGAGGFVGRAAARHLAVAGYRVRVASRQPERLAGPGIETARMPDAAEEGRSWEVLVEGVDHVVHCAGIAAASARIPPAEYNRVNVDLAGALATAARNRTSGRFVFLSSIRAVAAATESAVVTEATEPHPDSDYGRSKLEAERLLSSIFDGADAGRRVTLRPVVVHGDGAKGSIATLMRLARLPAPLPLAGLDARRSLLDVESLADAIRHVIEAPEAAGGTFAVCDHPALSVAEILAALRSGMGRRPGLFSLPDAALAAAIAATGRGAAWQRLSGPLVADPSRLEATGWRPAADTAERLAALAARSRR